VIADDGISTSPVIALREGWNGKSASWKIGFWTAELKEDIGCNPPERLILFFESRRPDLRIVVKTSDRVTLPDGSEARVALYNSRTYGWLDGRDVVAREMAGIKSAAAR
jgi:hypothetical protein